MSIVFKDRIETVRFTTEKNDTIEVTYRMDDGVIASYYLPVDATDYSFQMLLEEGWDIEKIQKSTIEFNRAQSRAYNQLIDAKLEDYKKDLRKEFQKKLNETLLASQATTIEKSMIFKSVMENNTDEETVFKIKLALFETPELKQLKDRAAKLNIRKAKTIIEVFAAYHEAMKEK